MFSKACVKNSVHKAEADTHALGRPPLQVDTSLGRHPLNRHPPPGQTSPPQAQVDNLTQADIPSCRHLPQVDTFPRQTSPPPRRPLHRTLRILLECILALRKPLLRSLPTLYNYEQKLLCNV